MAAVSLFSWVFLQAVLLLDVHCGPVKMGPYFMNNAGDTAGRSSQGPASMVKGGSTGGGSYSPDPVFYRPEEPEAPEGYGTSSAAALPSGKSNSHPSLTDSAQAIAWVIPPSVYSGDSKSGQGGATSGSAPSNAVPGPQFFPGELLQLESTMDAGRFISETQERGNPPPPPPQFAVNTEVFNSPPAQEASMPSSPYGYFYGDSKSGQGGAASGSAPSNAMPGPQFVPGELLQLESTMDAGRFISETQERGNPRPPPPPPPFAVNTEVFNSPPAQDGNFYPYDFMFVTGQYPPGTYAQARSSFEQGSDKFIENHYIRYEYPDSHGEERPKQPYPSDAWQGMGKGMPYH
ncbi:splicing factor 1-like isoform X1 [Gadus chalcogrammus]|uniref:splicing factor 1-like isoform X1 n=1 Tax=Gadus chalcogrammus TaxID=1042646 RepID=UPI0024C4D927|nr:splicing factor 1-like isoform X1 [Gadus chalcogrammus]